MCSTFVHSQFAQVHQHMPCIHVKLKLTSPATHHAYLFCSYAMPPCTSIRRCCVLTAVGGHNPHQTTPPASIHEALHSLLQGHSQPAPVPLLATRQAPCVQRTCDLLELYSLLRETNAAATQLLTQPSIASGTDEASVPAAFAEEGITDGSLQHKDRLAAAAVLQQGAQQVVIAMVEKVSQPETDTAASLLYWCCSRLLSRFCLQW